MRLNGWADSWAKMEGAVAVLGGQLDVSVLDVSRSAPPKDAKKFGMSSRKLRGAAT